MIFHSYVKLQEGDKERMGMHGDIYVSRGDLYRMHAYP